MRRPSLAAAWLVLVFSQVTAAAGQVPTATLTGRVRDAHGSPVPGAMVTVTGRGTGVSRQVHAGADGAFVLVQLPPGSVDVIVTATGFTDFRRRAGTTASRTDRVVSTCRDLPGSGPRK